MSLKKKLIWPLGNKNHEKSGNGEETRLDLSKTLSEWLYESLKPAGFDYAPWLKHKWEELTQTNDIKELQWIHDNISYNSDGTINIIKLNITICKDISSKGEKISKWDLRRSIMKRGEDWKEIYLVWEYKIMTAHDNTHSAEENKNSDWYQVLNIFSWGHWDTEKSRKLFKDISWFNDIYRTATYHYGDDSQYFRGQVYWDFREKIPSLTFDNSYYHTLKSYMCGIKKLV